jgi:hypothetical protein
MALDLRNRSIRPAAIGAYLSLLCVPMAAQFDHLVTNDDGSVLYLSTALRMRGSEQNEHRKLFIVDSQGLRFHTQRERERIEHVPESAWPVSTFYSIQAAVLNGDGSIVGITAHP